MIINYAIGDVEFYKKQQYLYLLYRADTLKEVVDYRYAAHSSFPCTIYKVDVSDIRELPITSGPSQGRNALMVRIVEKVGQYYDLKETGGAK